MNVYEFFEFSTLGCISQYGHTSWAIFIFMIYDSAGRKRNNFQQLSKLIELKIISTTWPNYITAYSYK